MIEEIIRGFMERGIIDVLRLLNNNYRIGETWRTEFLEEND